MIKYGQQSKIASVLFSDHYKCTLPLGFLNDISQMFDVFSYFFLDEIKNMVSEAAVI